MEKFHPTFESAVESYLIDAYMIPSGRGRTREVAGQSVSFLQRSLRQDGWRGLGSCLADFERMLQMNGFRIVEATSVRRGQRAMIVIGKAARTKVSL
jgi:hypothetical protein